MRLRLLAIAGLFAMTACGPTTNTYNLSVVNQSAQPMTIVLTKDGPPIETDWLPPEYIGMTKNPPPDLTVNGITLQPKQTVDQKRIGKFDSGTHAVLRVYRGEQNVRAMLGVSPDSPNRTDLTLRPGQNNIVIDATGTAVAK